MKKKVHEFGPGVVSQVSYNVLTKALFALNKNPAFNYQVQKIRKDFGIPPKRAFNKYKDKINRCIYVPRQWKGFVGEEKIDPDILLRSADLCKEFGFEPSQWKHAFHSFIFYDVFVHYGAAQPISQIVCYENSEAPPVENTKGFPVVLLVSPYAKAYEIVDFINHNYKSIIEPIQKRHRLESLQIGRTRKRKEGITKRNNEIIYLLFSKFYSIKEVKLHVNERYPESLWVTEDGIRQIKKRYRDNSF